VGLRISNIMEPPDYAEFPSYWDDPTLRKWNLWGYVDCRDVAHACRNALTAEVTGATVAIIAADDTVMPQPSAELMAQVYPSVPLRRELQGRETLLSIDLARRVLGYEPAHHWRDEVPMP
jgi:nucleoside-diphosphate-sugar epimerase